MNRRFDELTRSLARSVTRRKALRRLGTGLAGALLASLGLPPRAWADKTCATNADCGTGHLCCSGVCVSAGDNNNCGGCGVVCPAPCAIWSRSDRLRYLPAGSITFAGK